ncbi:MAG: hypothetical protein HY769_05150 [Candidatus Stahlbacteria bacterium]|nr:hypothetical protein [Candidatus Stahlbacteria bacterium]
MKNISLGVKILIGIIVMQSTAFARWSAIENIDINELGQYGAIYNERSLAIDTTGFKHVCYMSESGKGLPRLWHYAWKRPIYLWDRWQDTTFYSHPDQRLSPPYCNPVVITDMRNNTHIAWSYISDGPPGGDSGYVYYRRKTSAGVWNPLVIISPGRIRQPRYAAIGVNSTDTRRMVAYICTESGNTKLKARIYDTGSWQPEIEIASSSIDDYFPSVAIDEAGYFYLLYVQNGNLICQMRDKNSPYISLWTYTIGGVFGQCAADPINGNIHFANISNSKLIYQYRRNNDTNILNWYGIDTLLYSTTSGNVAISCYDSVVGIVSGTSLDNDTLYFKQINYSGLWNTVTLPLLDGRTYSGKSIAMDNAGYAHIIGNNCAFGGGIEIADSIFYFTDRVTPKIIILPDTIAMPDTGGSTYPGVPISYTHKVINKGNILDTFGIFIVSSKIDSVAALIWSYKSNTDTVYYPDTAYINSIWPEDTARVSLLIIPSDTCPPCFVDTTKFMAFSKFNPSARDSASDTTHIIINVNLFKFALSPPAGSTVAPNDTILYRIVLQDTWRVQIDSITIYDPISRNFDTVWVESTTADSDIYYFTPDTLVWTIFNQHLPRYADTLTLKGIVRTFDCSDILPQNIINFGFTKGTNCIAGDTSSYIIHNIVGTNIKLGLSKLPEPAHPNYDTLQPGDIITYYLECRNDSAFPADSVVICDSLDDDVLQVGYASGNPIITPNYVEWYVGCLLAHSMYSCTLRVRVGYEYKAAFQRMDTLYNKAFARGKISPANSYSDTTIHFIFRRLEIYTDKVANPPSGSICEPGDSIFYTLQVYLDTSANSIIRNISLIDTLDPLIDTAKYISGPYSYSHPIITWTIDSLAPGDSVSYTYWGFIDSAAPIGDSVINYYRFNYPSDTLVKIISDTTIHYIGREKIRKSAIPASRSWVEPNDTIYYTLTYFNMRPDTVYSVILIDTVDTIHLDIISISPPDSVFSGNAIRWNIGNIAPKDSFKTQFVAKVKSTAPAGDSIPNWGVFHGADTGRDYTVHYIRAVRRLWLNKDAYPPYPDRSLVSPGDTIKYYIAMRYSGNDSAHQVIVQDLIDTLLIDTCINITPPAIYNVSSIIWDLGNLPPGWIDTLKYQGIVKTTAPESTIINACYEIGIDTDTLTDTTFHFIRREEFTKLSLPVSGSWVAPNDTIYFGLLYHNMRPDTVGPVTLVDTLDTTHLVVEYISPDSMFIGNVISWDTTEVGPGNYFQGIIFTRVKADAPLGDTILNIGVVYGIDTDTSCTEHYIGMSITELIKSATPDSGSIVNTGDTIDYQLQCHNTGNRPGIGIVVVDTITNVDTAFVTAISTGNVLWSTIGTTRILSWTIDTIYPDSTELLSYSAIVTNAISDSVMNFAISDTFTSNKTIHYIEIPEMWFNKDAYSPFPDSSVVQPGNTIYYYIAMRNQGKDTAHQVRVYDLIDTLLIDTCINITPPAIYNVSSIIWDLGNLPPGWIDTLKYQGIVKTTAPESTIINTCYEIGIDTDTLTDTTFHFIRTERGKKWASPVSGTIVRHSDTIAFYLEYVGSIVDTQVIISDTLSPYLSAPFNITDNGIWTPSYITWTLNIPAGSRDTVSFKAYVLPSAPEGDTIYNYGVFEGESGTYSSSPTKHPIGVPHIRIEKNATPPSGTPVTAGDTISYTLRCISFGTDTARNIICYDTLSAYFTLPNIIIWNVGDVPPDTIIDTIFSRVVKPVLPDSAYGDTIFNIPVLMSFTDTEVDTVKDTTYHPINAAEFNISKIALTLSNSLLPEFSAVYPDSKFYYQINITNTGSVVAKNLIILDTIQNTTDCAVIDSVLLGPDSVWWNGNNLLVPKNVIGWWIPQLDTGAGVQMKYRVQIVTEGKNEILDTLDTLNNTCWIKANNILDSSATHTLYVGYKCGIEIKPDTFFFTFVGETKICPLRVKNTGNFNDSISIIGKNTSPGWQIFIASINDSSFLLPNVPPDSVCLLPVRLVAPNYSSTNTALVIARSLRSQRVNKIVEDTAVINIISGIRMVNIIVEPDTSAKTENFALYRYMRVINLGNDADVVDIEVEKQNNGWEYSLTFDNGSPLLDTDGDNKIDIGIIGPLDTTCLLLSVTPPKIETGINYTYIDTLVIWGTSSHNAAYDSVICNRDSAAVITELIIFNFSIHNYPNPFYKDEGTNFVIIIPTRTNCDLTIYSRKGEVIREVFENRPFEPGRHEILWDATNVYGKKIAAGTYIYKFLAGDKQIIKKLVVLPPRR